MCLSVLPSFVKAENGLDKIELRDGYMDLDFKMKAVNSTLNKDGKWIYYDLGSSYDLKFFNLSYKLTSNEMPLKLNYEFYDSNKKLFYDNRLLTLNNPDGFRVEFVSPPDKARYFAIRMDKNSVANKVVLDNLVLEVVPSNFKSITNIKFTPDVTSTKVSWVNPTDDKFTGVKIFEDNKEIGFFDKNVNSTKLVNMKADTYHTFKFVAMYGKDSSIGVYGSVRTLVDPSTVAPNPVTSLTSEPTDKTVKLKWIKPKDKDLAGFKILQDGKVIAEIGVEEEFTVKNLEPLTAYNFSVVAVDNDKNDSVPVVLTVKTLFKEDKEPPHVPSNVFAKPSNGALIASWDKVSDKDLAGYNVYVDGKKINNSLITSTTFVIKNLENGKKYKIQVQAVDHSGNASELSLAAFGTPDVNTIPVIENDYSVKDVSEGVGTMFSGLWLALAFAVSIPLAFYVIYKLKQTILS